MIKSSNSNGCELTTHIEHIRNRGGVSRLVAGPSACAYLKLNRQWSSTGKQAQFGAHQEGTLDGKIWHAILKAA